MQPSKTIYQGGALKFFFSKNVHLHCKIWCQRCHIVVTKLPTLNMLGGCRYKSICIYVTICLGHIMSLYGYVTMSMSLLCLCHYVYVTMSMSLCLCHYVYVTMSMSLCLCHYVYVTMSMSLCLCHYVYVTMCRTIK